MTRARRQGQKGQGIERPERASHLVIFKLRTTAGAVKKLTAAVNASASAEPTAGAVALLERLRNRGDIKAIESVFSALPPDARKDPAQVLAAAVRGIGEPGGAKRKGGLAKVGEAEGSVDPPAGLVSVTLADGVAPGKVARELERQPEVEYSYVPAMRYPAARGPLPEDPPDPVQTCRQWAHAAVGIHQARARASFPDSTEVRVGVVDSGIDDKHPALRGPTEFYRSYLGDKGTKDPTGHGSHVAGVVAAESQPGFRVTGLCRARLIVFKAMPGNPLAFDPIRYLNALREALRQGPNVLNLSLCGVEDKVEADLVRKLVAAHTTVVAAMGNNYEQGNDRQFPAACPGVIAVGATDELDRRAGFSCTGRHISLCAPGVNILSTVPTYPLHGANGISTHYASRSGTSFAAPHVSAAAALLLAAHPDWSPAQVQSRLMETADHGRGQKGFNASFGAGRLNIARALA